MKSNSDKIDDAVLAVVFPTSFREGKADFGVTRPGKVLWPIN